MRQLSLPKAWEANLNGGDKKVLVRLRDIFWDLCGKILMTEPHRIIFMIWIFLFYRIRNKDKYYW